jgi:hypothetical protein
MKTTRVPIRSHGTSWIFLATPIERLMPIQPANMTPRKTVSRFRGVLSTSQYRVWQI